MGKVGHTHHFLEIALVLALLILTFSVRNEAKLEMKNICMQGRRQKIFQGGGATEKKTEKIPNSTIKPLPGGTNGKKTEI